MKRNILIFLIPFLFPIITLSEDVSEFGKPQGAINDRASILTAETRSKLALYSKDIFKKTGVTVVFISVESIGDYSPSKMAEKIHSSWGIGKKSGDKGLLIFVSLREREFTIFGSSGIKNIVNDSRIINTKREAMTRYLLRDKWDEGISLVYSQIAEHLSVSNNTEPYTFLAFKERYAVKNVNKLDKKYLVFILLLLILIISTLPVIILGIFKLINSQKKISSTGFGGKIVIGGFGANKDWLKFNQK